MCIDKDFCIKEVKNPIMRYSTFLILLSALLFSIAGQTQTTNLQYTYAGEVVDEDGDPLIGANILVKGTTTGTVTDIDGKFQFNWSEACANLEISYTGFESVDQEVCAAQPIKVVLMGHAVLDEVVVMSGQSRLRQKLDAAFSRKSRHVSPISAYSARLEPQSREHYATINENTFIETAKEAVNTFGMDVDAASYSNVRRMLKNGNLPPADAVRTEEMINYFQYNYPAPRDNHPFGVTTELSTCPWNSDHQLMLVGLRAESMVKTQLPTANFVFLIDVSGSMGSPDKLPLLIQSLELLINNLREQDKVGIVVYAGAAGVVLEPTSGANKPKIKEALRNLRAGGSTAGGAGIECAYALARAHFVEGGNNRIILATDGDFNVGTSDHNGLETLITAQREYGIFLSVLGFGTGNLQDSKMELLADKGNGNYAYIDQLNEAKKVLVTEFGGTLFTVAKDVKLQVEFDKNQVAAYRLIGYENRLLDNQDFLDDAKDAGELGAGHTVTALYELIPQAQLATSPGVATVRLRYKQPEDAKSTGFETRVIGNVNAFGQSSVNLRWAAAVSEFAMLLRNSPHLEEATYDHCVSIAKQATGRDHFGYRAEMIGLINSAKDLAEKYSTTTVSE